MNKQIIRVAVVEDDSRLRRTFTDILDDADDCECVGVFATGQQAIRGIPPLAPDVLIMDVNLPDSSGVECVAALSPQLPDTQILMVTVYQDPETTFEALAAGAHGYLVKPVMRDQLLAAIRELRSGGVPMSPTIARKVIQTFRRQEPRLPPNGAAAPAGRLTFAAEKAPAEPDAETLAPREQQVLELLVKGYSYKDVSKELGISTSTVGTYVQRIYEKLHVSSRREIVDRLGKPMA
ncbi:MAG: response regulator transcription factor [Planctomycetia bacterium]|jgi:DNA-binding NarL/FixJ family response regulator|nr:response regulator transcription factor [Planctomycetia bacterium]